MRLHFINYSDAKYAAIQDQMNARAALSRQFDTVRGYCREWLKSTTFYREHKTLLDMPRGGGYWTWKPYILLDALSLADAGDLVVYQDCGDECRSFADLRARVVALMLTRDILLTRGTPGNGKFFRNANWTKRDCFVVMGCDSAEYWNAPQVEAGIIVAKKTPRAVGLLAEWLHFCTMPQVVSDDPNIFSLPNLPGFRDHRHDQSILTNLSVRHHLYPSRELSLLIDFNKYMP